MNAIPEVEEHYQYLNESACRDSKKKKAKGNHRWSLSSQLEGISDDSLDSVVDLSSGLGTKFNGKMGSLFGKMSFKRFSQF